MYGNKRPRRDSGSSFGFSRGENGGGFGGGFRSPVSVGEELDVEIESVGEKGDGIAKKQGFVIFVPGVQKGDKVKIKVNKVLKKMAFAEVVGQGGSSEQPAENSEEESKEEKFLI